MKRKLFIIALVAVSVCVTVACGSKGSSKDNVEVQQVTDEAGSDVKKAITDLVNAVYNDINASGNVDMKKLDIDLINKYGSKEFKELAGKISEIDLKKTADDSFSLSTWTFYDAPVEVEKIEVNVDGNQGDVSFILKKGGEKVDMIFDVVLEDGKWLFSDCERTGMMAGSFVERMASYIEDKQ